MDASSSTRLRRLVAVWFADIVGYTLLSSRDEDRALHLVHLLQEAATEAVEDSGRIVKFVGDAVLAEFSSTEPAVRAALALRDGFADRCREEGDAAERGEPVLRIGVHVGDVATGPDGDLYGDDVNTAARLQTAADPGQILASRAVWTHLRQRRAFHLTDLGERRLKGLAVPVRVYDVDRLDSASFASSGEQAPDAASTRSVGAASGEAGTHSGSTVEGPSIAVLPFANLGGHLEDEYFGDGMTEEIINALCQLGQMRVIARTSSFAFKGKNADVREIGRTLGVGHVLEGSVRRSGERIRVTAQLIQVCDGFHLWSHRFDRVLEDVFAIQDEVSLAIADHLRLHLLGPERARLTTHHTESVEAYDSYLLGRHFVEKVGEADLTRGIRHLERAVEDDPGYAQALAALSHAHFLLGFFSHQLPRDAFERARGYAVRALDLEERLAETRSALGLVKAYLDWDWTGAESEFEKALSLNPSSAAVHQWYAYMLVAVCDFDRAIREASLALESNPLSAESVGLAGWCLLRADRHEEAAKHLRRWVKYDTRAQLAHWLLGQIDMKEFRFDEGVSRIEEALRIAPDDPMIVGALGWAYAVAERGDDARRMLVRLDELSEGRYVDRYLYAKIWAGLGENDVAFRFLEEALARREMGVTTSLGDETMVSLRSDGRFGRVLQRLGVSDASLGSGEVRA